MPMAFENSIVSGSRKSTCLMSADVSDMYDFLSGGNICVMTIDAPRMHIDIASSLNDVTPISYISGVAFIHPSIVRGMNMNIRKQKNVQLLATMTASFSVSSKRLLFSAPQQYPSIGFIPLVTPNTGKVANELSLLYAPYTATVAVPNTAICLLTIPATIDVVACVIAAGVPTASISFIILRSGLKPLNDTGRLALLTTNMPYIPISIETACAVLDATAAPWIPIPAVNMSIGSRIITTRPPLICEIIGISILPEPCSTENESCEKMLPNPSRQIRRR